MSEIALRFETPVGATADTLHVMTGVAASSPGTALDMTTTNLWAGIQRGEFISITSTGTIYYRFSDATGSVDSTATSAPTWAGTIPANTIERLLVPEGASWFLVHSSNSTVRLWVSSELRA